MKSGIAASAISGSQATDPSSADAFSALIQVLADTAGQGADTTGGDGSGDQTNPQSGSTIIALQAAATAPQDQAKGKGAANHDDGGPATKQTDASGTMPTDLSALAILAAAAQVTSAQPSATDPKSISATGTTAAGATPAADIAATTPTQSPAAGAQPGQLAAPGAPETPAQNTAAEAAQAAAAAAGTMPGIAGAAAQLEQAGLNLAGKFAPPSQTAANGKTASTPTAPGGSTPGAKKTAPGALGDITRAGNARTKETAGAGGLPPSQAHAEPHGLSKSASHDTTAPETASQTSQATTAAATAAPQPQAEVAHDSTAAAAAAVSVAATPSAPAAAGSSAVNGTTSSVTPQTLTLTPRNMALAASAVAQVNVMLQRAGLSGTNALTVQLDPAELGRVEVKLKIEKNGPVHASVTADRPQTLEMLRNDRASLERALQSAGLNTDSGSLSFNLRNGGNSGQQTASFGQPAGRGGDNQSSTKVAELDLVPVQNGWTDSGRLDLRV